MNVNVKVAGTTFRPLPAGRAIRIVSEGTVANVPSAFARALLIPEPENPYDPGAVKVVVELSDGSPFHIGYLPKADPLKSQVTRMREALLLIKDFQSVGQGYSPSFIITEVKGM